MLQLHDIKKRYTMGDSYVDALKGIDISFRESEFVAILGQSGCGKTTLLNIIGGLDRYTTGDLVINGVSTRQYRDKDWDTYRNHSIGFIFQSYNLIPHQTVLANVELALTISGVSREERKRRATEALEKVGLGDQLDKKPNQMSGGQMQRVAIARALVNDPDILLADEPTGALDSQTSIQVMEILREVAKDKLVIMVTHNPDLAEEYANRIVRLKDGLLISDSNPFNPTETDIEAIMGTHLDKEKAKGKKTSMSFLTALSLSFKNLMTKKTRTILTSFAGSIGIIGIALILSVSQGFQRYVDTIERDTVGSYPLTITQTAMDMTSFMSSFITDDTSSAEREENTVYSNDIMVTMMTAMTSGITTNNLKDFKAFLDSDESGIKEHVTDIKYSYSTALNTYLYKDGKYVKGLKNGSELFAAMGMPAGSEMMISTSGAWVELIGNDDYIATQYELLSGRYPENANEVILIVDEDKSVTDFTLYCLGLRDVSELRSYLNHVYTNPGSENPVKIESTSYTYEELLGYSFKLLADSDYYKYENGRISRIDFDNNESSDYSQRDSIISGGVDVKIVGIVSGGESSVGGIGYKTELMTQMIERANSSEVVKAQKASEGTDLFTGKEFTVYTENDDQDALKAQIIAAIRAADTEGQMSAMPDEQLYSMINPQSRPAYEIANQMFASDETYSSRLSAMGYIDFTNPTSINIYPKDFEAKDKITAIIDGYNDRAAEKDKITYSDMVAMLMGSVNTIVNAVSYVLIAFVSISLVVSSIMIGIITYISVLERTKEIGILRAIGASKRDISRVFNAETIIVGFVAGLIGIIVSLLALLPINAILHALTGIKELSAVLPPLAAVILIAISVFLTVIAGLIPSGVAAKKDPVIALRSE